MKSQYVTRHKYLTPHTGYQTENSIKVIIRSAEVIKKIKITIKTGSTDNLPILILLI